MWICENCGQPNDPQEEICVMCSVARPASAALQAQTPEAPPVEQSPAEPKVTAKSEPPEPPAPKKKEEPVVEKPAPVQTSNSTSVETMQASHSFDFSAGKEKKEEAKSDISPEQQAARKEPEAVKAEPETDNEPAIIETPERGAGTQERPIVTILRRLARTPRFWIVLGSIVAGFILIPWTIGQIAKLSKKKPEDFMAAQVEPEVRKKFELMIDDSIPDKLEWGRAVLRKRVPTRFPEEMTLEFDKQKAEVKYENKKKTDAHYRLQVCYHFTDANKKTYVWQPVTFYFELRDGVWTMVGDHWLREAQMIIE